ncbi:serine palmitoyltransferase component [Tulasnella sp. 330]|nr:serine palmitoyltransferase component [Tulasnella sp. 330]KAG8882138.1 serine palmitoyltransferase component [Tulasnella sp. 331]KAG8887738.1 serine palmitoyltransferase component [Tulasnella sp. 332]
MSSSASSPIEPLVAFLAHALILAQKTFTAIPGSPIVVRYVRSSYQNDPGRSVLELILVIFAVRTLMQSRTRSRSQKGYVKLSEKEVDELVDEWVPEPLVPPMDEDEYAELAAMPVIAGPSGPRPKLASNGKTVLNLASYNFTGLQGNEHIKERAVEILRKYGLGSCGPPGFYGTIDVHMDLERNIASFLGAESCIIYSQGFSTISSVIPAFSKRGDIIIADRGVNFAIQKALQISRSTIRWFDHNDLKSLEETLESVAKETKKKKSPLTRRFIVTEGIFENDGAMADLPKLIELKKKYKYRLVLDESMSFGTVGRTGRGLTELYNVPATEVDMIVGSMANGLCATGGFCVGSTAITEHQRINGTAFVFSAAMPALLAVSASEGISILTATPSLLENLHENARTIRSVLEKLSPELIEIPSHSASAVTHIYIRSGLLNGGSNGSNSSVSTITGFLQPNSPLTHRHNTSTSPSNPTMLASAKNAVVGTDWALEDKVLQEVVDEALAQGVMITRAKRLRGQESLEPRASIKVVATAALTKKESEKAAGVVKAALTKVLGRRR